MEQSLREGLLVLPVPWGVASAVQVLIGPVLTGLAKNRYHNGGQIAFGPDGKLYATVGDAKNSGNAQNKNSLNGKILRMNPDGTPPADNPFFSSGGNARYVWSWGHRNPQGLAWDSRGQLWAAEYRQRPVTPTAG